MATFGTICITWQSVNTFHELEKLTVFPTTELHWREDESSNYLGLTIELLSENVDWLSTTTHIHRIIYNFNKLHINYRTHGKQYLKTTSFWSFSRIYFILNIFIFYISEQSKIHCKVNSLVRNLKSKFRSEEVKHLYLYTRRQGSSSGVFRACKKTNVWTDCMQLRKPRIKKPKLTHSNEQHSSEEAVDSQKV